MVVQPENVQEFVIPGVLPQLNDVVRASKGHWSSYAREKKKTENAIIAYIKQQKLSPIEGKVYFHFTWYSPDYKVDPDNMAFAKKYIIDSLVRAGILPSGDGRKTVAGWIDDFPEKDPERPRIEVSIFQLREIEDVSPEDTSCD